jgi:two-component sensor histidine kinase
MARALATRSSHLDTKRIVKRPDGSSVTVLANSSPLLDDAGELTGAVVAFYDVTELEMLQQRNQRLTRIAQAVNADGRLHDILRMVRDAVVETAGFDRAGIWIYEEAKNRLVGSWGTSTNGLPLDESGEQFPLRPGDDRGFARLLSGETNVHKAYKDDPPAGSEPVCDGAALALAADERVIGMLFVDNLITGRPVTDEALDALHPFCEQAAVAIESARLRQTEREQTAWLKEAVKITNHRVKNNLQVTLAIIDTELIEGAPVDRATLERIRRQIRIIGSVHEFLGDVSPELDTSLCEVLERVLGVFEFGRKVTHTLECDDLVVNTKQATAAALILDELVTDAGRRDAKAVRITLRGLSGSARLEASDDGQALPPGFKIDPNADKGLGFVERLARWDLLGHVTFANRSDAGVCVAVDFPLTAQASPGRPPAWD